jgi:RNA polymerase sigma factor (TIGR02999 family)
MAEHERATVTRLLRDWRSGDAEALEELTPLIYDELRRLAHHMMRAEQPGHLLQTTALVHEAYLRLVDIDLDCDDRGHFYRIAARQMRRVLVDYARRRLAVKRGGGAAALPLEAVTAASDPSFEVLALDEALRALAKVDARKAQTVELRSFGGLTIDETAAALGVSHATVERDLKLAKAWLRRALSLPGSLASEDSTTDRPHPDRT